MSNHAKTETSDGLSSHPIVNQLAVLMAAACQATQLGADIVQASTLVASLVDLELGQDQPEPHLIKVADALVAPSKSHGADALGIDGREQVEWEATERPVKKEVVQRLRDLNRPFVLRNLVARNRLGGQSSVPKRERFKMTGNGAIVQAAEVMGKLMLANLDSAADCRRSR
jgi:hypothetical protein